MSHWTFSGQALKHENVEDYLKSKVRSLKEFHSKKSNGEFKTSTRLLANVMHFIKRWVASLWYKNIIIDHFHHLSSCSWIFFFFFLGVGWVSVGMRMHVPRFSNLMWQSVWIRRKWLALNGKLKLEKYIVSAE